MIDPDEDEDGEGWDEDGSDETVPCPDCRADVYEDAERCPECGRYLSREDAPRRHPWWVVAGALACLAMVFWWILHP